MGGRTRRSTGESRLLFFSGSKGSTAGVGTTKGKLLGKQAAAAVRTQFRYANAVSRQRDAGPSTHIFSPSLLLLLSSNRIAHHATPREKRRNNKTTAPSHLFPATTSYNFVCVQTHSANTHSPTVAHRYARATYHTQRATSSISIIISEEERN